jgi:hypothetical protein
MATDLFTLGGVVFDEFSTPSEPPFGGSQAMAVHKLPGGSRVIDLLGPDDTDYTFNGVFWGDSAFANAEALDALRVSGQPTVLSWGGRSWLVIVQHASIECCRFPNYYKYSVQVVVAQNNMFGALGAFAAGIDDLISADMNNALSIVGL